VNEPGLRASLADGHLKGIDDDLVAHVVGHLPAGDPT
jgi:hypothetical protein